MVFGGLLFGLPSACLARMCTKLADLSASSSLKMSRSSGSSNLALGTVENGVFAGVFRMEGNVLEKWMVKNGLREIYRCRGDWPSD